jgi:hypothetical protein
VAIAHFKINVMMGVVALIDGGQASHYENSFFNQTTFCDRLSTVLSSRAIALQKIEFL